VIYGTGGSGTRVLVKFARHFGYFMGGALNNAEDSVPLYRFYEKWSTVYLQENGWLRAAAHGEPISMDAPDAVVEAFRAALEEHLVGRPSPETPWGWKNPRALLILPLIHHVAPRFRAVHLVRDGRDMAFSEQMSIFRWGVEESIGYAPEQTGFAVQPLRMARLWSFLNLVAANFARDHLGEDGLILRFEDLCASPRAVAEQVARFLDVNPSEEALAAAAAEVTPPETLGRHRFLNLAQIEADLTPGLRRFGYV
jgi:hypothetical protein